MPVKKKSVVLSWIKKVQTNHFDFNFNFESLNVFSVLQESSVSLEDVLLLKKPWNLDLSGMLRIEFV